MGKCQLWPVACHGFNFYVYLCYLDNRIMLSVRKSHKTVFITICGQSLVEPNQGSHRSLKTGKKVKKNFLQGKIREFEKIWEKSGNLPWTGIYFARILIN